MTATLTILGSNSALPAQGRHPSAQVLQIGNALYLIDCGEGTQLQMSHYAIRRSKIKAIFISHLHGDHIYGLPGLITSYNHYGRSQRLTLYGPVGLKRFVEYAVFITNNPLQFELEIIEFNPEEPNVLIAEEVLTVETVTLVHRIPTAGFIFSIKNQLYKIREGVFDAYQVDFTRRSAIQHGADYTSPEGQIIPNSVFATPPGPPVRYAYLSDTVYQPALAEQLKGVDTLYHEATFLSDLADKAVATKHSTAAEAAEFARRAAVRQLIIGHFSSRYSDLQPLLVEAQSIFPNTQLAVEGKTFDVGM